MILNISKNFIFLSLKVFNLIDKVLPIRLLTLDEIYTANYYKYKYIYGLFHYLLKGLYLGALVYLIGFVTIGLKNFEEKYIEDDKKKSIYKYLLAIIWYSINLIGYYLYYITETRYGGLVKSIYILLLALVYLLVPSAFYNGYLVF